MVRINDGIQWIEKRWRIFTKTRRDIREFLDGPDWVFILIATPFLGFVYLKGFWSWPQMAVAVFTALYAFIASNQMRQESQTQTANVRRDYKYNPETDSYTFGLRNFGPGPALYLRVYATVVKGIEKDEEETVVAQKPFLEEDDPPMSLEEGEFLPLVDDGFLPMSDDDFPPLEPQNEDMEMRLYYSFVSRNGVETPEQQHKPRDKSHRDLKNDSPDPRSIKLSTLREHCTQDRKKATKAV
jgi:hypothetical protein